MSNHTEPRKTIVINQSLATSSTFTVNIYPSVQFVPSKIILRQMLYCNIAGADAGTYLLWCDLTGDYVAAVYVGIQGVYMNPETIIPLFSPVTSITFRLDRANTAFPNPSGQITLTLEFAK